MPKHRSCLTKSIFDLRTTNIVCTATCYDWFSALHHTKGMLEQVQKLITMPYDTETRNRLITYIGHKLPSTLSHHYISTLATTLHCQSYNFITAYESLLRTPTCYDLLSPSQDLKYILEQPLSLSCNGIQSRDAKMTYLNS